MTPAGPPASPGSAPAAVMGVLNVTPDSFSDGGLHLSPERAVERARQMAADGAAVVDVGGESTRPGATAVDPAEEQSRVVPVIEAVVSELGPTGLRCSVDTRNPATARAAVAAGATLINDVSASLWPVAAETGAGWVAMHMLGDPATMQLEPHYDDVVDDVRRFLDERATAAERAGVAEVWVDPGIGFGKTTEHNVALIARIDRLVTDGRPVMVGTSRKRSMGVLLAHSDAGAGSGDDVDPGGGAVAGDGGGSGGPANHAESAAGRAYFGQREPLPVQDRLEGSLATATWAIIRGARMVRVHDVGATVRATLALRTAGHTRR